MARFTLIATMLSGSRPFVDQQRFKLGSELRPERGDDPIGNVGGKCFRQCKWGYSGMTATNFDIQLQVKNFEKLPTHRAAQFGNCYHIVLQGLGKYE